jgi:hypothetical protein
MFGSNILDIAIGLVFLFLLLSLICSAANELIEGMLKQRAKDLEKGITELLGDDSTKSFVRKIYDHGLVNALFRGNYATAPKSKLPSYIPSRNFALALISIANDATNQATLPKNVKSAMDSFKQTAANDAAQLQKSVEDWYNSAMDRVSGWYKRRTQIFIFVLGCILALFVNADCVQYAQRLSKDSSLRQSVVAMAEATAKANPLKDDKTEPVEKVKKEINTLDGIGLPIGWGDHHYEHSLKGGRSAIHDHAIGWILTALAISLGAPFWFDTLNRLMVVRSTVKPHEKSREESSKDSAKTSDSVKVLGQSSS